MGATRQQYRELTEAEKDQIKAIKVKAEEMLDLVPQTNREFSLARTKIEEAAMWAVKGITG